MGYSYLVQFSLRKVWHERTDQHGRFTLANKGRGSRDDGLGTGHTHGPEEEDGELANEPLEHAPVVEQLHERNEEDDWRDDTNQEPADAWNIWISQEDDTLVGEAEEFSGELGNEAEDVVTSGGSQDEETDDELHQHTNDDLFLRSESASTLQMYSELTGCQLIILRFLDVSQSKKMKTARPNKLTARFSRVLSAVSSLAIAPTMITEMTSAAPAGILSFSGMRLLNRTPVLFHTQCMGLEMIVIGTCQKMTRRTTQSHSKNGMIQFLSLRCSTRDAIHQL
jgi:hypothetical protein